MLATFKETLKSVQDKSYGQAIVAKRLKSVLWYWYKYLLLLFSVPLVLVILAATYFTPQLSKLVDKNLPDISLEMKNAILSSSLSKPLVVSEAGQAFILDTSGQYRNLDDFSSGVLVGSTSAIVKESPGSVTTHTYTDVRDFTLTKAIVSSWLSMHTPQVWLIIVGIALLIWIATLLFYTSFLTSLMLVSAVVLRLAFRPVSFRDALKISYYALVPTMLLSAILFIAPNQLLFMINLAVFAFLSISWTKNLPATPKN